MDMAPWTWHHGHGLGGAGGSHLWAVDGPFFYVWLGSFWVGWGGDFVEVWAFSLPLRATPCLRRPS